MSTQARGFYNLGVELEYLRNLDESLSAYNEAIKLSKVCMSNDEEFRTLVKKGIKSVKLK